jgi:carboxyl-terminal processing protease
MVPRAGGHRTLALGALALAAASGCSRALVGPGRSSDEMAEFEAVWSWVDSLYPAFTPKGIDWDARYSFYRPLARAARGDELLPILSDMLADLEDGHVYLQTSGGGVVFPYLTRRFLRDRGAFDPHLTRAHLRGEVHVSHDEVLEYGLLDEGTGYLRIVTFDREGMAETLDRAMDFLQETSALVVDVRNNNGGKSANVATLVGSFIEAPMQWMDAFEQDGVPFQPWPAIQPDETRAAYEKPTVLIVNGAVMSAGELLAEVMRQLPFVTLVGDTTAGAACNDYHDVPGDLRLASGRLVHVPTACVGRYDGQLIERNGVPPDRYVPMTTRDVQNDRDVQLEAAIQLLFSN